MGFIINAIVIKTIYNTKVLTLREMNKQNYFIGYTIYKV